MIARSIGRPFWKTKFQMSITFFLCKISPTMYILTERWDSELFKKNFDFVPFCTQNGILALGLSYGFLGKWVFSLKSALSEDWGRINLAIFNWKKVKYQKIWFSTFLCFFAPKTVFSAQNVPNPHFKKIENRQKFDFPKMVSKYVLISKFCRKWFFKAQRAIFEPYFTFFGTFRPLEKNDDFGSKSHFSWFFNVVHYGPQSCGRWSKIWKMHVNMFFRCLRCLYISWMS